MPEIKVSKLNLPGSSLFSDSESYLTELTETEAITTQGGTGLLTITLSSLPCLAKLNFYLYKQYISNRR